jgi:hypothetical protein
MPHKAAAFNIDLSRLACPRCRRLGLSEIDEAVYCGARTKDKHLAWPLSDPVAYARCDSCFLVLGLPDARAPGSAPLPAEKD